MNRLMVFIDAEYVVQKIKDLPKTRKTVRRKDIRWENILRWITARRQLERCYYYSSEFSREENLQTYQEQQDSLRKLKLRIPYFEIKLGRLVRVYDGWVQKGVDVKIALDMFAKAAANHYDTAALLSGDSDFTEVITKIKENHGKQIELYTFDKSIHEALLLAPDRHIVIDASLTSRYSFWEE